MKCLDVVGNVPPPFGGVTIHNSRLACYAASKGWSVRVFDFGKRRNFMFAENIAVYPFGFQNLSSLLRLLFSKTVIHFHGGPWFLWCLFGFLGLLGRKVLLGVHTSSWLMKRYASENSVKKLLFKVCSRGFSCVTVSHAWIERFVSSLDLPFRRVVLVSSYIAPVPQPEDYQAIPAKVWSFIEDHKPVLGGYAYRLNFIDGVDVYGLDLLVPLLHRLKSQGFRDVGLLVVMPHAGDSVYYNGVKRRIRTLGVERNILFAEGERQAYPVWPSLDVFIRPTCTDADALTVRECLSVGVPVVASDCVERPEEAVTFKCRSLEDLEAKVRMVLADIQKYQVKKLGCSAETFMGLYEGLAS